MMEEVTKFLEYIMLQYEGLKEGCVESAAVMGMPLPAMVEHVSYCSLVLDLDEVSHQLASQPGVPICWTMAMILDRATTQL